MALVDYESSDSEQEQAQQVPPPKKKPSSSKKQTFEKFVDKSNPGKISLNIAPEPAKIPQEDPSGVLEPPAKRAKTGGLGGFNSLLPAPKRTNVVTPGPRKVVQLKTGAEPAFTRELMPETQNYDVDPKGSIGLNVPESNAGPAVGVEENPVAKSDGHSEASPENLPKRKATIFKPLSVARKPQKKTSAPPHGQGPRTSTNELKAKQSDAAPKLSLFSVGEASEATESSVNSRAPYQPIIYQRDEDVSRVPDSTPQSTPQFPSTYEDPSPRAQAESLNDIAVDLNLSASARRQLLGRNQRDGSTASIKITNFNTDQEYAANEALRQSGEIVQHNAVRGVAPGKHSLKQLVNAATNQKDALEEQFAAGRRNKSEAGARYGW